jgi:hypothetical protein
VWAGIAGVLTALGLAAWPGSPAAATTSVFTISGKFALYWPRSADAPRNAPCDPGSLCGSGTLSGLGAATITIDDDEVTPIEGTPCFAIDRVETLHLVSGLGDAVLVSSGTACAPGGSIDAADQGSYGNPIFWSLDWTLEGADSSGLFSAATGSGHEDFFFAGAVGSWTLTGSATTG